ncbi:hypothetical protein AB7C87_03845 [Natrarchaeobius sp. A-rgal3]
MATEALEEAGRSAIEADGGDGVIRSSDETYSDVTSYLDLKGIDAE